MRPVFKLLSLLPLWLLHGLGWCMGWLAFMGSATYRQRFIAHARQAGLGWQDWSAAVGASGQLIAELPRLWLGNPVTVQWDGAEHIEAARAAQQGIVFLTPHMGCFEVTAQAYAARYGHTDAPMTVLFRPPRQRWLREVVTASRARPGLMTAPTTLSGVKQLITALKRGQCVGLLPDQVPPMGQGLWVPFFGRDAYTMTLSARLALQPNTTVLLAWGERLSWGRGYVVHVCPLAQTLSTDLPQATVQINQAMEALVRQSPGQYLWGYARYKTPRLES
ncbi:lysophospholipid acyltransferase family protein [Rhodoferax saidenbachensis]|uniref:Lipid A biosynthesis acyltransferase n=1 Tax=Rhodoferax saidenbachensis TaxID=1484693 RepID=A0A1P8KD45_9BURK|nr:lysophospholipid acyltransferase family protein [Rhodoferax saidenbachensis]APW43960.1 lipid A biosynthesis acyltransferase [Rhodoferax saidenbachensis]